MIGSVSDQVCGATSLTVLTDSELRLHLAHERSFTDFLSLISDMKTLWQDVMIQDIIKVAAPEGTLQRRAAKWRLWSKNFTVNTQNGGRRNMSVSYSMLTTVC